MKNQDETTLTEEQPSLGTRRVKKLIIKNFRCIGTTPVEIELDEIVVLVGANNAGKSTILRAYEVVMNSEKLDLADFPNEKVTTDFPEIELQTYIDPDAKDQPGAEWQLEDTETGWHFVRERWTWNSPNQAPVRKGFSTIANDWSERGVPWGANNVAKAQRPIPHRVDAFANPEDQAKEVVKIIKEFLQRIVETPAGDAGELPSVWDTTKQRLIQLHDGLLDLSKSEIAAIEEELSHIVSQVFAGYIVRIKPQISEKALSHFTDVELCMGQAEIILPPLKNMAVVHGARFYGQH